LLIWGFTAALLDGVLRLGGWEQEWDHTRTEPLPEEVMTLARRGRLAQGSALGAAPGTVPGMDPAGGLEAMGPLDGSGAGENK
jgi:hypothetical protein